VSTQGWDLDPSDGSGLEVNLDRPLPATLPTGHATAVFCVGSCFHRHRAVSEVNLVVDDVSHRPIAQGMPRLDRFRELHPTLSRREARSAERDPDSPLDPELRSYRSGFWATIPIESRDRPGELEVALNARLADGTTGRSPLGTIEVTESPDPLPYEAAPRIDEPLIAVCMATYNPNMELFRTQIDSIREQTYGNWVCVISDDCSEPEAFDAIADFVQGDDRFLLSRADSHLSTRSGAGRVSRPLRPG
jgi:hypothetical protein